MKNLYIVLYDYSLIGGAEKVALNLANEFSDLCNVTVISVFSKNVNPIVDLNPNVVQVVISQKPASLTLNAFNFAYKIRSKIKLNNGGSILSITAGLNTIVKLSSLGSGLKTVYAEHSNLDNDQYGFKHKFRQKLGAKHFDAVVTLTDTDKERFKEKYKVPDSRVYTIYNWVERPSDYKVVKYDTSSKKIVSLGRTVKVKGYDRAVRVSRILFDKYPDWIWEIYGEGDEFDNLSKLIEENNLASNLILKGFTTDIDSALKDKSIFVSTSTYEGFPLSFLEARDYGLPIVSFDCPTGPKEIIEDEVDGILIYPYDEAEMAIALCNLIEDEDKRKQMSENVFNSREKFSKKNSVNKWKELLLNE